MQVIGGVSGLHADVDTLRSLYSRLNPIPGDHYRVAFKTGSLAFTNGVAIATFVNAGASPIVLTRFRARVKPMAIWTPAAAGLEAALSLFVARSWTVVGSTGRTAVSLTGNNNKMRTSMATAGANFGIASAVGGITGDTLTEDANPIATDSGTPQNHSVTAAATPGAGQQDSFDCDMLFQSNINNGEYPLVLAQNEGVRLKFLATGTPGALMVLGDVAWSEVSAYPAGD